MIDEDKVLQMVRFRGPVLPVNLTSQLKADTIFVGAILSTLVANGKLKVSYAKIGGSPVYYTNEQRPKLEILYKHLNEKDRRAYDLLKEKQIVSDPELTPLLRVCMRNLKDFAFAIEVNYDNKNEIFWRWHLLPDEEAKELIRQKLNPEPAKEEKLPVKEELKPEPPKSVAPIPAELPPLQQEVKKEQPVIEQQKLVQKKQPKQKLEKPLVQTQIEAKQEVTANIEDEFNDKILEYFSKNSIKVKETTLLRKNSDIEYIIEIPSPIGNILYYCKAKSKKRSNDGDLASAFLAGQMKKLPVLYITTGEIGKKALEKLSTDFSNMKIQKI